MVEMIIRNWRITRGVPGGMHMWFDPSCEVVRLHRIPSSDSEEASDLLEGVDRPEGFGYVDKVGSVSADGQGMGEKFQQIEISFIGDEDDLPF